MAAYDSPMTMVPLAKVPVAIVSASLAAEVRAAMASIRVSAAAHQGFSSFDALVAAVGSPELLQCPSPDCG